jgi:hypothetical protein
VPRKNLTFWVGGSLKIRGKRQKGIGIDALAVNIALKKSKTQHVQGHFFERAKVEATAQNRKALRISVKQPHPQSIFEKIRSVHVFSPVIVNLYTR